MLFFIKGPEAQMTGFLCRTSLSTLFCGEKKNKPHTVSETEKHFFGSSRKVRERDRKKPDEGKEEMVISVPISQALSDFNLVVIPLEFSR